MTQSTVADTSQAQTPSNIKQPLLSRRARHWLGHGAAYIFMTALALVFMIPILWMLSTSLKARWEVFAWPPQWIPETIHWENYVEAFTRYPMGRFMLNSTILVAATIVGELFAVPLVAYGFARLRFPGKNVLFLIMLGTMMIPGHIKLIPLFTIYHRLGWIDTYLPLIVPAFFGSPFFIFLMVQYMKTIPRDLDDAARIDGAGTWGILYRVLLPLCVPPLTIVVVFTFLWTWNEFLHPLIFLNSFELFPVQVGLALFKGRYSVEWNLFMAATLISIIPILILYFFSQKQLIGGIASVGLKG
ncbi:MAG: carbohydrate ABC transporter permease [Chloroflexota bacterium]|nr:carbohydrate ABC transporter permease [Chloroflexota bacterium]